MAQHSDEENDWGKGKQQHAPWDPQDSLYDDISDPPARDPCGVSISSEFLHAAAERKQATDRRERRNRYLGSGRFLVAEEAEETEPLRAPGAAASDEVNFSFRLEQEQKPIEEIPLLLGRNYLVVLAIIVVKPHFLPDELDRAVYSVVG